MLDNVLQRITMNTDDKGANEMTDVEEIEKELQQMGVTKNMDSISGALSVLTALKGHRIDDDMLETVWQWLRQQTGVAA